MKFRYFKADEFDITKFNLEIVTGYGELRQFAISSATNDGTKGELIAISSSKFKSEYMQKKYPIGGSMIKLMERSIPLGANIEDIFTFSNFDTRIVELMTDGNVDSVCYVDNSIFSIFFDRRIPLSSTTDILGEVSGHILRKEYTIKDEDGIDIHLCEDIVFNDLDVVVKTVKTAVVMCASNRISDSFVKKSYMGEEISGTIYKFY